MPYMLLAFVYNPLQTCVTYLALGLYVLSAYLLFWAIQYPFTSYINFIKSGITVYDLIPFLRFYAPQSYTDRGNDIKPVLGICMFISYTVLVLLGTGMVLAVFYFSAAIIYVLTLGSLNDFEVIQNLVPPLLIGVLTYFVVKPTYKQAKQKINLDDESDIEKLLKEHTKEDTNSKFAIIQISNTSKNVLKEHTPCTKKDTQIEIHRDSTVLQYTETDV